MNAYIINLDNKKEKFECVSKQLKVLNIQHSRFIALTRPSPLFLKKSQSTFFTDAMMGCASSHMELWERIQKENTEYALILEDDVKFLSGFKKRFLFYMSYVPKNWDMIVLGTIMKQGDSNTLEKVHGCFYDYGKNYNVNKYVYRLKNFIGAHAYILSKQGAKKLVKGIDISSGHIDLDISKYLSSHSSFTAYCFNTDLVVQQNTLFESSINVNRQPFFINSILDTEWILNNGEKKMSVAYVLNEPIGQIKGVQINAMNACILLLGCLFGLFKVTILYPICIFSIIETAFLKVENVSVGLSGYAKILWVFIAGYTIGRVLNTT